MKLVVECYRMSKRFPSSERYGLTSQVQRAAVSIPANVAEGSGRHSDREFARFVRIAKGSANELETLLLVAQSVGYLDDAPARQMAARIAGVRRQLSGLEKRLR